MVASKGAKMPAKADGTDVADRIATALEQLVEKLGNIEVKLEELTYELQAHGNAIADAVAFVPGEEMEMGCGTGCGASEQASKFIQIEK
jgi:ribose 5-phosphate isomerase RpiB